MKIVWTEREIKQLFGIHLYFSQQKFNHFKNTLHYFRENTDRFNPTDLVPQVVSYDFGTVKTGRNGGNEKL